MAWNIGKLGRTATAAATMAAVALIIAIPALVMASVQMHWWYGNNENNACTSTVAYLTTSGNISSQACTQVLNSGPNLTIIYIEINTHLDPPAIGNAYTFINTQGIQHVLYTPPGSQFYGEILPPGTTEIIFNYHNPGVIGTCLRVLPVSDAFIHVCACDNGDAGFFYGMYKRDQPRAAPLAKA